MAERIQKPWPEVEVISFGFKYREAPEADLLIDARILPNPFYVDGLRIMSGLDAPVRDYIFSHPEAKEFFNRLTLLAESYISLAAEKKNPKVRIAVGCTGGHHRSVAVASLLTEYLKTHEIPAVNVNCDLLQPAEGK